MSINSRIATLRLAKKLDSHRNESLDMENWVCPDDRQLALRGQLGAGWINKGPALSAEEQAKIVEVIKRAEQFEQSEQARIEKMVEKIESLKKGAFGDGVTTCVICGSQITSLRIFTVKCYICDKLVCESCAVHSEFSAGNQRKQVRLCRICNEIREALRCSGAWLFKEIPQKLSALLPYDKLCATSERKSNETPGSDNGAEQTCVSKLPTATLERTTSSPEQNSHQKERNNNHNVTNLTLVSGLSLSATHVARPPRPIASIPEPPIVCLPCPVAPKLDAQLYINEELARVQAQQQEKSKKHHRKVSIAVVGPALESTSALACLASPRPPTCRRVSLSHLNDAEVQACAAAAARPKANIPHRGSFNEYERTRPQIAPRLSVNTTEHQRRPSFVAAFTSLIDKDKNKEGKTSERPRDGKDSRRPTVANLDDSTKSLSLTLPVPPASAWLTPAETRKSPSGARVSPATIRRTHSNKFPIGDMQQTPLVHRRDTPTADN